MISSMESTPRSGIPKKKRPSSSLGPHGGGARNGTPLSSPALPSGSIDMPVDLSKVRAYAACRSCRAKKVKCLPSNTLMSNQPDAPPPPCQQCVTAGLECTYPPTRDRAAYSRQYVQNLEARVQALETVNMRLIPLLEAFEGNPGGAGETSRLHHIINPTRDLQRPKTEPIYPQDLPPMSMGGRGGGDRSGEEEEEGDSGEGEDLDGDRSDMEDDNGAGGQMTQDERGNYRWIGSSNTLSLLDSFSTRPPKDLPHLETDDHHHFTPPIPGEGRASLSRHDSATANASSNPYFGPVAGSGVVKALPGVDEVSYPSRSDSLQMIDAFFAEVHPCLPVVIEHDFRDEFAKVMDRRDRHEPEIEGGFVSVLFAIFALGERAVIASRAWQRERTKLSKGEVDDQETVLPGEAEAGVIWYERAQILHYTTIKDVTIHQVQCLTLMAAFQAAVNAMPMSWLLAGQALRIAQDLGLHRLNNPRIKMSFAEKQIRSRCWWAIYGLERIVSISLGRPLGVDDLDIDIAYPADIDDAALRNMRRSAESPPAHIEEPHASVMSGFVALTKLCKIAGRVAHVLYRPSNGRNITDPSWAQSQQNTINKLDKLLRDWLANEVPTKYKDPSASRPVQLVSAVLSNSYFTVLITLHRNFLPPNPDYPRPKPPPSSLSLSHCVDAARSVIHIAAQSRVLVPPSHHLAVFCQYLWSSAVILLLCEVQAKDQVVIDAVGAKVEACRRSLQALEPAWPGCRKLKELLNDVESRTKEVLVAATSPKATMIPKKRKTSAEGKRAMVPPSGGRTKSSQSSTTAAGGRVSNPDTWSHSSSSPMSAGNVNLTNPGEIPKRARIGPYETSDTRTAMTTRRDDIAPPLSATYSNPQHSGTSNNGMIFQSMQSQQPNPLTQPFDLFDVGGVTFDGLEMLQGFSGTDMSSMWTSLAENNWVQTPAASVTGGGGGSGIPQGYPASSSNGTPNSSTGFPGGHGNDQGGSGGGSNWQFSTPGGTGTGGNAGGLGGLDGTDFWNQVAGGSFDWQADPSVPFNMEWTE